MFDWAFYKTPKFIQILFQSFLWKKDVDEKAIYLTFDDGPIPELTTHILSILEEYKAEATFFCVGDNIIKYPDLFNQLIEKGHSVGNHTFNHLKAWKTPAEKYLQNVMLCQTAIENSNVSGNKLFRPPYGQITFKTAKELKSNGFEIVMWDVLSKDYERELSWKKILKESIKNTSNGSIIVFHDNVKAKDKILQLLPLYLKHFSDIGYKFKKL